MCLTRSFLIQCPLGMVGNFLHIFLHYVVRNAKLVNKIDMAKFLSKKISNLMKKNHQVAEILRGSFAELWFN